MSIGKCKKRNYFSCQGFYRPQFGRVVKTDLPLDDYLYREMTEIIRHTNELTRSLYDAQDDL